jgi:branched-chain amino acid transport system substrate-binding protein
MRSDHTVFPTHGRRSFLAFSALSAVMALSEPVSRVAWGQAPVRIGVANDMSGVYAAVGGPGSVIAARMAAEDFGGRVLGRGIEIVSGDTQNKPDVAVGLVHEWFDRMGVSVVLDSGGSAVGLALQALVQQRGKLFLNTGATSSEFIGKSCTPTAFQFVANTRGIAIAGLEPALGAGVDTWYFVTADYAFGHALQADATDVILAHGARVVGATKHPLGTADMSSYLEQARSSGARGVIFANAGADLVNCLKQAKEFRLVEGRTLIGLLVNISDLQALGRGGAEALQFSTTFYPAMTPDALAWSRRFASRNRDRPPTMIQAMTYSATLQYLKAVDALQVDDNEKVAAWLHDHTLNDALMRNVKVRRDGRVMNDLHVVRVKPARDIDDPFDTLEHLATLRAEQVYAIPDKSACALLNQ